MPVNTLAVSANRPGPCEPGPLPGGRAYRPHMELDSDEPRSERKPIAVVIVLALLALVGLLWLSPTLQYWSETGFYIENGADPTYPLLAAILYTLATAGCAAAFFGVLKRRFWGRVTGIVIGGLGLLGTISTAAAGGPAMAVLLVMMLFGAIAGLLFTADAAAWCQRRRKGART